MSADDENLKTDNVEEDKIIQQLKESLDFLDNKVSVNIPNINQFRRLVAQVEEKKQVKKTNQLMLFLLSAIVVLSFETYTFYKSFDVFVAVQILSVIIFPVTVLGLRISRNRRVSKNENRS